MNPAVAEITDVFNASMRSDECVVPLGVRRIHALFIGCLDSVVQLHHHHIVILDIQFAVQTFQLKRRPAVRLP